MFNIKPFENIRKFCIDEKIEPMIEKLLYSKFIEDYNEYTKEKQLNEVSEESTISILVGKNTLKRNVDIIKSELEKYSKNREVLLEIKYKVKNTFYNICINILSSILFMSLLLLIFAIAENQIRPIINDFIKPRPNIEENIEKGK